ncbi:hypothetical protein [Paenibacillus sp. OAS669]|uniref:hypothetical protein n=1 Tax=Paenibacillus sp. OAS669 TaxID=2663821 RepID=UPI00178AA372|nr:hypothetical protein [Paenibacillus sp. OAS669]MBE1444238.1 hypothetical protein [Paenibacillus sp. OAS669]
MAKKKRPNTPRAKRMNREGRLQSAVSWLKKYNGSHYIRGYCQHFGVDTGTAIVELRQLGVSLSDEAVRSAKVGVQAAARGKQAHKAKRVQRLQEVILIPWSDETYAFIAGYTAWGIPYGITWEESEWLADQESLDNSVLP